MVTVVVIRREAGVPGGGVPAMPRTMTVCAVDDGRVTPAWARTVAGFDSGVIVRV